MNEKFDDSTLFRQDYKAPGAFDDSVIFSPDYQAPPPPEKPSTATLGNFVSDASKTISDFPEQLGGAVASLVEGSDPSTVFKEKDWKDELINEARAKSSKNHISAGGDTYVDFLGIKINRNDIRNFSQNAAFSLVSMGSSIAGALMAAPIPVPGSSMAAAAATGGASAYRMDTNNILRSLREGMDSEAVKQTGKALTDDQFIAIAEAPEMQKMAAEYGLQWNGRGSAEELIREHGLQEAGWEAAGNVIMMGTGKALFKAAQKSGILKPILTFIGGSTGEVLSEAGTQLGQHNTEIELGLDSSREKREYTSLEDWRKSVQEVAGSTLLLTGTMGAASYGVGKLIQKGERAGGKQVEDVAAEITQNVEAIDRSEFNDVADYNQTIIDGIYEPATELTGGEPVSDPSSYAPEIGSKKGTTEPVDEQLSVEQRINQLFKADNIVDHGEAKRPSPLTLEQKNQAMMDQGVTPETMAEGAGMFQDVPRETSIVQPMAPADFDRSNVESQLKSLYAETKRLETESKGQTIPNYVAASGGINWDEAVAQGIDPADIKAANKKGMPFGKPLFKQGGKSFDEVAELLNEAGVQSVMDGEGYSANASLDLIQTFVTSGEPVYMPSDERQVFDAENELRAKTGLIEQYEKQLSEIDEYEQIKSTKGDKAADEFFYGNRALDLYQEMQDSGELQDDAFYNDEPVTADTQFNEQDEGLAALLDQAVAVNPELATQEFERLVDASDAEIIEAMNAIIEGETDERQAKTSRDSGGKPKEQEAGDTVEAETQATGVQKEPEKVSTKKELGDFPGTEQKWKPDKGLPEVLKRQSGLADEDIIETDKTPEMLKPQSGAGELGKFPGMEKKEAIDEAAHEAATSPENNRKEPSTAQKSVENYKTGDIPKDLIHGLDVKIENPKGSYRFKIDIDQLNELGKTYKGVESAVTDLEDSSKIPSAFKKLESLSKSIPALKPILEKGWFNEMKSHYGKFAGTTGADLDPVDVFLGEGAHNEKLPVFIIDQTNKDGSYDESKVMVGYANEKSARQGYLENYDKGWTGLGAISELSLDELKTWLSDGDTKAPYSSNLAAAKQELAAAKQVAGKKPTPKATELPDTAKPDAKDVVKTTKPVETGSKLVVDEKAAKAILDSAKVTGTDRLDVMAKFRDGTYSLDDLKSAYPAIQKEEKVESKPTQEAEKVDTGQVSDEAKPSFSRGKKPQTETEAEAHALGTDDVKTITDSLQKDVGANIQVVDTEASLPKEIKAQAELEGATGEIRAVHWKGDIYIVADQMRDSRDVSMAVIHEGQHFSGDNYFGKDKGLAYQALWMKIGGVSGMKKLAKASGFSMDSYFKTADKLIQDKTIDSRQRAVYLVDEFLAHTKQQQAYESLPARIKRAIKEFLGKIRDLMRKSGFVELPKANDADISYLLKTMNSSVRGKPKGGVFNKVPAFMVFHHASPHRFDRFSMAFIGTGEGAQAFGHGIYMAEDKNIAGHYLKAVPHAQAVREFLSALPEDAEIDEVMELIGQNVFSDNQEAVLKALDKDDWLGFDYPSQAISAAYRDIDNYDPSPKLKEAIEDSGVMYTVEIQDEQVANFLDWDAPLSGQPEFVQKAIRKAYEISPNTDYVIKDNESDTGSEYYGGLRIDDAQGASKEVSELLNSIGIKGIKYYDAGSRAEGKGTRNLVVFDDSIIEITAINGKPVTKPESEKAIAEITDNFDEIAKMNAEMNIQPVDQYAPSFDMDMRQDFPDQREIVKDLPKAQRDRWEYLINEKIYLINETKRLNDAKLSFPKNAKNIDKKLTDIVEKFNVLDKEQMEIQRQVDQKKLGKPVDPSDPNILFSRTQPLTNEETWDTHETLMEKLEAKAIYRWNRIAKLQKKIHGEHNAPAESDAVKKEATFYGKVGEGFEVIEREYLDPAMEVLKENDLERQDLEQWMYAVHAPERNAWILQIDPGNPKGSGITDAEATAIRNEFTLGQRAALKEAALNIRAMLNENLDMQVDHGVIKPEIRAALREKYPNYVPLQGNKEEETLLAALTGKKFDIRGTGLKRALGRVTPAENILPYAIAKAEAGVIRAEKAVVGQAIANLYMDAPDPTIWKLHKVKTKQSVDGQGDLFEELLDEISDIDEAASNVTTTKKTLRNGKVVNAIDPAWMNKPNIFAFRIAGEQYYLDVKDEALVRQLKGLGVVESGPFVKVLAATNRYLAGIYTSFNPDFVFTNAMRDIQMALTNIASQTGHLEGMHDNPDGFKKKLKREILKNWGPALKAVWQHERNKDADTKMGRYYNEMRKGGGKVAFYSMQDIDSMKKRLDRKIKSEGVTKATIRSVFNFVSHANSAVENAVRLSTYAALRERKVSIQDAAFVDRNLTVDFNRKGESASVANALWLFFNASAQGARVSINVGERLIKSKKGRLFLAGSISAGFMLAEMSRQAMGEGDDDRDKWDTIPDYMKRRNLLFAYGPGDTDIAKFTLPYGLNLIPNMGYWLNDLAHYAASDGVKGKSPLAVAKEAVIATVSATNPIGNVYPTILTPVVDVGIMNENFAGYQINKEHGSFEKPLKPDSETYFPSFNKSWEKDFASAMNSVTGGDEYSAGLIDVAPGTIRYAFNYVTGGLGATVGRMIDMAKDAPTGFENTEPYRIPIIRNFAGGLSKSQVGRDYRKNVQESLEFMERIKNSPVTERKGLIKANQRKYKVGRMALFSEKKLLKIYKKRNKARSADQDGYVKLSNNRIKDIQNRFNKEFYAK